MNDGIGEDEVFNRLFAKKEMQIFMVSLDTIRETTILYKLKFGEIVTTIPTIGHFIADCPKRSGYKKGTGSSFHDSGKHESPSFNKGKPKTRFFKKALKDYRRENKKRDKAFFAEMEKSYSKRSTSSSSSSSSSDEEISIKKGKDKDDPAGLCFMAFGDKPKSRSHQCRRSRKSFYSMALGDREEKSSSDDSDDDDSKVLKSCEKRNVDNALIKGEIEEPC
ncbi:hypothetical protein GUJ93_ZPchr0013g34766 [Zizania palustris]|uniref:Uncharacterized protein n=1 Tax=Zizania palustris TaxID=103762 RepID=A0A8J6BYT8_ZIZPA|nr:hypothetical protein GUJ93_ZPchr0013g34766 [Zizania palustris]